MPINGEELINAAELVCEQKEVKVALKCSAAGAGLSALTTFAGGILAGPIGLVTGATVGGLCAYSLTKNKFKPVVQILREELTYTQKEQLANHLRNALKDLDITDAVKLFSVISCGEVTVIITIFKVVEKFLESNKGYKMLDRS
ncbi:protein Nazo isoform X2 [Halyomorpha halys]